VQPPSNSAPICFFESRHRTPSRVPLNIGHKITLNIKRYKPKNAGAFKSRPIPIKENVDVQILSRFFILTFRFFLRRQRKRGRGKEKN
jgi:hypothetical protein